MELYPRETVILADDYKKMVDWYCTVLGFKITRRYEKEYHYANLENSQGIQLGIGVAKEMGTEDPNRKQNTVLLQFEVKDVSEFLKYIKEEGGGVTFGPSYDEQVGFWYGAFEDPEGNPMWVVDGNCP